MWFSRADLDRIAAACAASGDPETRRLAAELRAAAAPHSAARWAARLRVPGTAELTPQQMLYVISKIALAVSKPGQDWKARVRAVMRAVERQMWQAQAYREE